MDSLFLIVFKIWWILFLLLFIISTLIKFLRNMINFLWLLSMEVIRVRSISRRYIYILSSKFKRGTTSIIIKTSATLSVTQCKIDSFTITDQNSSVFNLLILEYLRIFKMFRRLLVLIEFNRLSQTCSRLNISHFNYFQIRFNHSISQISPEVNMEFYHMNMDYAYLNRLNIYYMMERCFLRKQIRLIVVLKFYSKGKSSLRI